MAQGKMKAKTQLPKNMKKKSKGAPVTKRANRPIQPKKKSFEDAKKLKQVISKTVNKTVEDEIRSRASGSESKSTLSKAQQAVAEHHKKNPTPVPS